MFKFSILFCIATLSSAHNVGRPPMSASTGWTEKVTASREYIER